MATDFYDCTDLLAMKDTNGEDPVIFIVSSRVRGPGKTFSFIWKLLRDYFDEGKKFILLCRTQTEVGSVAQGQMKAVLDVKYKGTTVHENRKQGGVYSEIMLQRVDKDSGEKFDTHVGYVVAINAADSVKKISSTFTDADAIYFDEFMPEFTSTYLKGEVDKFYSIYKSVARGGGSTTRRVPVYMSSNTISIANPYFLAMGLSDKIQPNTKRVRGEGVVFQRATNEGLIKEHAQHPFDRAMGGLRAGDYGDNSWLNDHDSGVGRPDNWGPSRYLGTLIHGEMSYGFHYYQEMGYLYVSHSVDKTSPFKFRVDKEGDVTAQPVRGSALGLWVRRHVNNGTIRFQNQAIKLMAAQYLL